MVPPMKTALAAQATEMSSGLLPTVPFPAPLPGDAVTVQVWEGAEGCRVIVNENTVPLTSVFGAAPRAVLPLVLRMQPAWQSPASAFVIVNGLVPVSPDTLTVNRNGLGVHVTVTAIGVVLPAVPVALPESVQVDAMGFVGCPLSVTLYAAPLFTVLTKGWGPTEFGGARTPAGVRVLVTPASSLSETDSPAPRQPMAGVPAPHTTVAVTVIWLVSQLRRCQENVLATDSCSGSCSRSPSRRQTAPSGRRSRRQVRCTRGRSSATGATGFRAVTLYVLPLGTLVANMKLPGLVVFVGTMKLSPPLSWSVTGSGDGFDAASNTILPEMVYVFVVQVMSTEFTFIAPTVPPPLVTTQVRAVGMDGLFWTVTA